MKKVTKRARVDDLWDTITRQRDLAWYHKQRLKEMNDGLD
jgi:hypothetical protein